MVIAFPQVKVEESFVPAFKDKAAEVSNLLAEPKCDHASVDGVLSFGRENLGKSSGMDGFSYEFEFGFRTNCGNTLMVSYYPFSCCYVCPHDFLI